MPKNPLLLVFLFTIASFFYFPVVRQSTNRRPILQPPVVVLATPRGCPHKLGQAQGPAPTVLQG